LCFNQQGGASNSREVIEAPASISREVRHEEYQAHKNCQEDDTENANG